MKNKYKLLGLIIIIIIAASGVFYFNKAIITGFAVAGPSGNDKIPETHNKILTSNQELHIRPDNSTYVVPTRYDIGKDAFCKIDCANYCLSQELELYKAYSRRFGECMCKCLLKRSEE